VRNSGQVSGSAPITLEGPAGTINLKEGLICARRHVHMHPDDAKHFGVTDKDQVSISVVGGERDLTFGDVLIRVNEQYRLEMHIDTDEANAAEIETRASDGQSSMLQSSGKLSPIDVDELEENAYSTAVKSHAKLAS